MPLISKPNYNQIFASQAPEQDKPAVFNNYPGGWGVESRPNNGKPTIKGFNYLQQTSDLKDLWILQNGACLPYDESIEYAEGAPVLKDGVIQYKTADGFKSRDAVTVPTYNNAVDGVDPVTGVPNGAYFNVHSSSGDSYIDEYQNVGGTPTPTGKSYPSSNALNNISHNNLKNRDAAEAHPASAILDSSGKAQQELNNVIFTSVNNIANLIEVRFAKSVFVRSHHDDSKLGGGVYSWSDTQLKNTHDGGRVIDPLKIPSIPTDWTNVAQVTAWLNSSNTGAGCWVRDNQEIQTIFNYGFTPNSQAHAPTNTLVFQKLVDNNIVSRVPYYNAPLYVTNGINIKNGRRVVGDSDYMNEPLLADPDRGIIGDGTGAVFTTGTYPATANTNRQLHFKSLKVRNTNYPCIDLFHSDDAVFDDCHMYTSEAAAINMLFSARTRIFGGHYGATFATYSDNNFAIKIYDNCNGTWISPTAVITGGTNGGAIDVTKSQKVVLDGIIETNGGYGIRVAGYAGGDLPLWQANTAYVRGDRVKNTTSAWVCKTAHTSGTEFASTNWEVTNGNCNAVTINGYYEATNKPISIGVNNLVLGANLGTSSLYVATGGAVNPEFCLELGAISGLNLRGGSSFYKKGTEPTFKFVQRMGSSITDYLTNSTIKNFHVQGGGPDYTNALTIPDQVGLLFGRNEIKLNQTAITSGQVREFISPVITANVGVVVNAFIINTGNGGIIDAIEVIDATGTLGCTIRVGNSDVGGENLIVDPSTLTMTNGSSATTLLSPLIRPNKQQVIRVIAGSGTGSFRVKINYRM